MLCFNAWGYFPIFFIIFRFIIFPRYEETSPACPGCVPPANCVYLHAKKESRILWRFHHRSGRQARWYIVKIGERATAEKLADQYDLVGAGVGGNKVYDLYLRMDDDVMAKDPDIVFIYIGVNDVRHKREYFTATD